MKTKSMTIWMMVVVAMSLAVVKTVRAEDTYWVGTTGDWFHPANWQYKVPELGDDAFINNGGTAEIIGGSGEARVIYVGYSNGNSGSISHSNGMLSPHGVRLGELNGSTGTYNLSGTGQLSAGWAEIIGSSGTGTFNQSSGTNFADSFIVALYGGSTGTYNLSGTGQLSARVVRIGSGGTGIFHQTGGINTAGRIEIGEHGNGTYNLYGTSQLLAGDEFIGGQGTGTFNQTGGTNSANYFEVAQWSASTGTYNLSGTGELSTTGDQKIGSYGTGVFNQSGGTNTVGKNLVLGSEVGANGRYTISGGTLSAQKLQVGRWGTGRFDIEDPAASITVSDVLFFGVDSTFTAVPGSTIHMDGSLLDNWNTDETDLAGLNNLSLIFEGGAGVGTFEVAGEDLGVVMSGFDENFALADLIIGGVDIGQVQLVDWRDNMAGIEALYVKDFILGNGSYLDLNGLNLYYQNFMDYGGTIVGGEPIFVPEPASALIFGLGGFFLVLRRRRRQD